MADYWQNKMNELNKSKPASSTRPAPDYWQIKMNKLEAKKKKKKEEDIAPVANVNKDEGNKRKWFNTSVFDDGYQFGDVSKAILGTLTDVGEDLTTGVVGMGEQVVDALAGIAPAAMRAQYYTADAPLMDMKTQKLVDEVYEESKKKSAEFIQKDLYDERKVAQQILGGLSAGSYLGNVAQNGMVTPQDMELAQELRAGTQNYIDTEMETSSLLGDKADSLVQSAGQLGATAALQAAGIPWWATTALTSGGAEMEAALNEGATYEQAATSAMVSAGAEILTEKISGGISFGGKTLDDVLTKQIARSTTNKVLRTLQKLGVDMAGEGAEEVLSGVMSAVGQKMTYAKEKELNELFSSEDAWESFIGGAVLGGVGSVTGAVKAKEKGIDAVTELTGNEQKVIDKYYNDQLAEAEKKKGAKLTQREKSRLYDHVLEDMEKGRISTDTIEEVLGGDDFKAYKESLDNENALKEEIKGYQSEYEELKKKTDLSLEEEVRKAELPKLFAEAQAKLGDETRTKQQESLRSKLDLNVYGMTKNDRLRESFFERVRAEEDFEADVEQYTGKGKAVIQSVIDSKLVDNTRASHEFWDTVAKIATEQDLDFVVADDAQILEMVKADIEADGKTFDAKAFEGKTFDGYIHNGKIVLNAKSDRGLNFVVGHELTHSLDKAKSYGSLEKFILEYGKDEYKQRFKERAAQYSGVYSEEDYETAVKREVVADMVGDYLFNNQKFVENLATTDRNLFQKIWDEIKHLCKLVTAGSKEARELEKVKHTFEQVYREGGKAQAKGDVKHSLSASNVIGSLYNHDTVNLNKTVVDDNIEEFQKKWDKGYYSSVVGAIAKHTGKSEAEVWDAFADVLMQNEGIAKVDGKTYINVHELNEKQLREVFEMGGLAAPSIGIVDVDKPVTNFGNISLIFPDIFNPEIVPTYYGDSYSQSLPAVAKFTDETMLRDALEYGFDGMEYSGILSNEEISELLDDLKQVYFYDERQRTSHSISGNGFRNAQEFAKSYDVKSIPGLLKLYNGMKGNFDSYQQFLEDFAEKAFTNKRLHKANTGNPIYDWDNRAYQFRDYSLYDAVEEMTARGDADFKFATGGKVANYDEMLAPGMRAKLKAQSGGYYEAKPQRAVYLDEATYAVVPESTSADVVERLESEGIEVVKYTAKEGYTGVADGRAEAIKGILERDTTGIRYSLSDSTGKQLTPEQSEFFKDSKVRDENGNLLVMYHGTPNGDFTVFKDGTYFTANKEYADRYQTPSASSISAGKVASAPKTFEVYLDIKKPFDISDAEARDIYINEYIKGGNAMGINPYLSDAEYDKITSVDWTEGEDLRDFLIEEGYDYDGLILDEGADGGYGDEVKSRGVSYVVFSPEQVKNVDNQSPTSDPDIRFSLSKPVEETKDLMALHNLHTAELLETIKLNGLPSPSVAIIKAKDGHEKYGDVSLILPKGAIDPQANKANRIYGSDAWTPTRSNAQVEYEVDYNIQRQFERAIEDLSKNVANGVFSKSSVLGMAGIEGSTGLNLNEIVKKISDYDAVQAAYVAETGGDVDVVYRTKEFDPYGNDALKGYIDTVGEQEVARLTAKMMTGERLSAEEVEVAKDALVAVWVEKKAYTLKQKPELRESRIAKFRDRLTNMRVEDFVRHAWEFYEDSGATTDEIDRGATGDNLRGAVNRADVEAWVTEKLQGLLSEPGIYNGKDVFTPSGKQRSFKETHWDYTAENIVKAMNNADARGANVWNVSGEAIIATATPEYKSIDEVRADKDRLHKADDDYYEQIKDEISAELQTVTKDIIRTTEHHSDNQYEEEQIVGRVIMEAAQGTKTVAAVKRVFQKNGYRIGDAQVKSVLSLFDRASNVPTGYFEAKPQRVVGLDEVGVFVIPNNADVKLKQELLNRGYSIAEYDPDIEGHRQQVVNQFEEYKFSLSDAGSSRPGSKFNIDDRWDVRARHFQQDDLAPYLNATLGTSEETAGVQPEAMPRSNARMTDEEVAAFTRKHLDGVNGMFPDDFAPMSDADDAARFASLTDADAPAEVEAAPHRTAAKVPLTKKAEANIARQVREQLGLNNHQMAGAHDLIKAYSEDVVTDRDSLIDALRDRFGEYTVSVPDDTLADIKRELRNSVISVSDKIKGDINDYGNFVKSDVFGRVRTNPNGTPVDVRYSELQEAYGTGYFPDDIINPTDQFLRIVEIANSPAEQTYSEPIDEETLAEVADTIIRGVEEFRYSLSEDAAEQEASEAADSLAAMGDEVAPADDPSATLYETAYGQRAFEAQPETPAERRFTRKELHSGIIDNFKAEFKARGFDFDDVLRKAKNLSTFATVDNTPQRVMEKALGPKEGKILADITVNKVAQNETEATKWLNSFTDRKNGVLAQISKQYNIKPGSKESAAAQMYGEGFYVDANDNLVAYGDAELAKDFPDARVQANIKGLAADPRIRQIYDETLAAINESRTRNAYPEIPRLDNYYLHFRAMDDTFSRLGLPFNPNDIRAKDLPTDLNGVTADLKPGQPYFASAMHRNGKRTSFDLLGGLEQYLTSAKNQIYHIDDIQTLRALRNYIADTYGQAHGLENLDAMSEEEAQDRIEQVYGAHLSTFAKFLNEEANILAGKTALIDRGVEGIIGRRGITFLNTVNRQVGSNMVGYSISSSLTNFLPVAQAFAKTNKFDFTKAFAQTVGNKVGSIFGRNDGFAENSPVMIRRKGADRFYRTLWQKMADPGYALMGAVDEISTELIARTKYNEFTRNGMDSQRAHIEADKWVSRLMGDRSLGQQPLLYNSKMLGLVTKFQLEVRIQLDSQFYDTIQEAKMANEDIENALARNAKTAAKVTSTFVQLAVVQHLFGKAFESVAGYNPAFDIIEVMLTACGFDDDDESEDTVLDNIEQGFLALLEDMPYASTFMDGGRIPISSALPIGELIKGEDEWGNEKSRWETLAEIAPYYALPAGYGQIKKTAAGLGMFSDDHPIAGSYTDSGNLRFPVEDTLGNRIHAGIFGQYANENARDYFDNERSPLKDNQIQEFIDVDIPIQEYWDYREGLAKQDTLEKKFDYIAGLNLPVEKKNILINNIVDRKEDVDMENYEDFSTYEEFDWYSKNTEKYNFLQENGVSYSTYTAATEDEKQAYDSAWNWYNKEDNAEKVTVAKTVTDNIIEYRQYTGDINAFRADYDENGKPISGSAKAKKRDYIFSLDLDYGQKAILYRSQFDSKDDKAEFNAYIVDYLNSRSDISYEDMVTILEELDMTVHADGTITW